MERYEQVELQKAREVQNENFKTVRECLSRMPGTITFRII